MPDRDRILAASLSGIAQRHARDGASPAVAVPELLERAAGRTDLLADAAGRAIGGYLASPLYPADLLAAHYLAIAAGHERDVIDLIAPAADETRRAAEVGGGWGIAGRPS